MPTLSSSQARRVALAAQGFLRRRPGGRVDRRHVRGVFDRVGLLQIDSVNVLVRAQELPLWSRLGPHRRDLLPSMAGRAELFEYWGHAASLIPVDDQPLLRWRMAAARQGAMWDGLRDLLARHPGYVEAVYDEVRDRGPLSAGELETAGKRAGPWWDWNDGKQALEVLFACGRLAALRRTNFERVYDLTERVLTAEVLARPDVAEVDAQRALIARAAAALGVATVADLADYYRLRPGAARPRIDELVEEGTLLPVAVEGWKQTAYLHASARVPRRVEARTLVSPFDSLIWERSRTERLFGFSYRIEIYTPSPKRVYGYYVLPFLLGDRLVARVDLKADRKASALLVPGAFAEPGVDVPPVAEHLAAELRDLATWLELERVSVGSRGNLAAPLRAALPSVGTLMYRTGS